MRTALVQSSSSNNSSQTSFELDTSRNRGAIAWTSFLFALLQNLCAFVIAINGLRLAIGIGSLVMTAGAGAAIVRFHAGWIRFPMLGLALVGALVNLAVLLHLRILRGRPASQWRRAPLRPREVRTERIQLILSLATLLLIGFEEVLHFRITRGF